MSEELPHTEDMSKKWCPTCEPERDPSREILLVNYCYLHTPNRAGVDDAALHSETFFGSHLGTIEADGVTNKLFSDTLKKIEEDRKCE